MRDGSSSTVPDLRTSPKPYLLINRIKAADVPTMVWVRSPALLPWMVRSRPTSDVSRTQPGVRRVVGCLGQVH
jgi:hypothetical protein